MTMPGMRPIPDPQAEMERLAAERMAAPAILARGLFLEDGLPGARTAYVVDITVTARQARQAGEEPAPWPYPVTADLGSRIMDLIRRDCAENPPAF
jgi:hypothetical protein